MSTKNTYKPKKVNYRKIWEDAYGPIPKDRFGRSYEIHHIDGNRNNNSLDNLACISIQEHYYIHLAQDDYGACYLIARRMDISPEELSELAKQSIIKRTKNGTNPFSKRKDGSSISSDRVNNGTHHFLTRPDGSSISSDRVNNGTNPFSKRKDGSSISSDRVNNGTHHLLKRPDGTSIASEQIKKGTHIQQKTFTCPHCNKTGKGTNMFKYHFDRCKTI